MSVINEIDLNDAEKIAIIAVFPTNQKIKSTLRLIQYLEKNDFKVLLVINQNAVFNDLYFSNFKSLNLTILLRPNIGRDFGAYQAGFKYLLQNKFLNSTKQVVFANDSCFYGPKSLQFITESLSSQAPWQALFLNFELHTHCQSFFIGFASEIFNSNHFKNFWLHYYPTSLRHRVINNGEVALTQLLFKCGYVPDAHVSSLNPNIFAHVESMTVYELDSLWNRESFWELWESTNFKQLQRLQIDHVLIESNATHRLGLYLSRVVGAPLKFDLLKTGYVTMSGIKQTLEEMGVQNDEIEDVFSLFILTGSHASVRGFTKIWRLYGYA